MKYGYKNQNEWVETMYATAFGKETVNFLINGYRPMMKRKTLTQDDLNALKALNEVLAEMNAHAEELIKADKIK